MSSSLSWGNVPSVSANQQQRNSKPTSIKRNAKDPQQQQQDNSQQRTNDNNYTVDEFVQRVTNLSKQVEQYKQLSNQRAQQVAISFFNNNNSSALSGNGTIQSASSDSFNHSQDNLRVGGNDITKKIRSIRQWCTSEVNELKKISNKIGSKIGNENRLMMESGLNSNTESNSSSINSQHETMVKYNRVKNDLTKTITVLKDVIRRDKEWIAQQTKQKQELFAAHQTPLSDVYDEEEEIHAEDHPLLSGSASNASHHGGKTSQVVQELQENALVSWQDSTLNVEMKIAMEEYEDLKTYQSEYHELNHLFHSFSTLVDEQDPMLDTIHTNVITSKDNVERGVESLKESNKLRKQGSKVMWIVLALVLLTVIAVALIIIFGKGVIW